MFILLIGVLFFFYIYCFFFNKFFKGVCFLFEECELIWEKVDGIGSEG